ncbi:MAG: hypothetical protein OEV66_05935 [Spirochaetia bacterium]|nr:hypothetical protein [Spirochaetia bacterium]
MEKSKEPAQKYVVCINNDNFPASLELHKIYRVAPEAQIKSEGNIDIRIIDESGEDYIYPSSCFVLIDVPQKVEESLQKAS